MNKFKIVRWLKGGLWYNTEEKGWITYDEIHSFWREAKLMTVLKSEYYG